MQNKASQLLLLFKFNNVTCHPLQYSLLYSRAYWVSRSIIAWDVDDVGGYDLIIELERDDQRLPEKVRDKFPHIKDYKAFNVHAALDLKSILKDQVAVALFGSSRQCISVTGLQLPSVIDDIFSYMGPLGAIFSNEVVSLYLWAPTAQDVHAHIYSGASGNEVLEIVQLKESSDVWCVNVPRSLEGCYYVYEGAVYHPEDEKPDTVHPEVHGGYLAFTSQDSAGILHLKKLSDAGLTHIHLLPTFQFGDVDDQKENWKFDQIWSWANLCLWILPSNRNTSHPSKMKMDTTGGYYLRRNADGFIENSTCANNTASEHFLVDRLIVDDILNWVVNYKTGVKNMLKNLSMDKDKIDGSNMVKVGILVQWQTMDSLLYSPAYWVSRSIIAWDVDDVGGSSFLYSSKSASLSVAGNIIEGVDSAPIVLFLTQFPCFGLLMRSLILQIFSDIRDFSSNDSTVYPEVRGGYLAFILSYNPVLWGVPKGSYAINADGAEIYKRGNIATCKWSNLNSLLIAPGYYLRRNADGFIENNTCVNKTASEHFMVDRLIVDDILNWVVDYKDALLGGSPFGHPLQQGFLTGLSLQVMLSQMVMTMVPRLMRHVGMAANLKDYVLTYCDGQVVKGSEILTYGGALVAYALQPVETIKYVSAHDNETLFDIISLKVDHEQDRQVKVDREQDQQVDFECSKSLDRDSYNSGDWLNRIDFSYNSNKWDVGLPPKGKNEKNWPFTRKISKSVAYQSIRYSSVLFRLRTANAIQMSTANSVKNSTYDPLTGCFSVPSRTSSVFVELCNIQE
ncbi:hypothetical protein E3N88_03129 [Mikania micrantha]|uniref:Pullulanase N2 domain-containing protein n=1 Tax=Mikania micrantha TaxID=192012 RepID=A0A5N6Q656_9ASTR|nr:hypothetical protein E3N88_03129 [Mikania micrantha]